MKAQGRSFGLVDQKVTEADFFLQKLASSGVDVLAARSYTSAFASAARAVTNAMQAVLHDQSGFAQWYEQHQRFLKRDPICRFFHDFRIAAFHIGDNPVSAGDLRHWWFMPTPDMPNVPREDVVTACNAYMTAVVSVVFECYGRFGPLIDARQRYTAKYFAAIGKTIEDAEEDFGLPRGWTDIGRPDLAPYRWQILRDMTIGCEINELFAKYLGKTTSAPERLPELPREALGHRGTGWIYVPEEFRRTGDPERDIEAYLKTLRAEHDATE